MEGAEKVSLHQDIHNYLRSKTKLSQWNISKGFNFVILGEPGENNCIAGQGNTTCWIRFRNNHRPTFHGFASKIQRWMGGVHWSGNKRSKKQRRAESKNCQKQSSHQTAPNMLQKSTDVNLKVSVTGCGTLLNDHSSEKAVERMIKNLEEHRSTLQYCFEVAQATMSSLSGRPRRREPSGQNLAFTCSNC